MKRFEFRLDSLLNLRRMAEDGAKRAFGEARMVTERQRESVAKAAAEETKAMSELRAAQTGRELRVADLLAHQRHMGAIARRVAAEKARLGELTAAEAKAREALAAAMKDRKVLDRLRERRAAEWQVEMLKDEQRAIDEASASSRAAGGVR